MSLSPDQLSRYRSTLYKAINDKTDVLADGKASDYAHYKEITGKIAGIEYALESLDEILQQSDIDDE